SSALWCCGNAPTCVDGCHPPRTRYVLPVQTPQARPWHGVLVATALPFHPDLSIDLDRYAEHVRFLASRGCHGIVPNGSLGECQTLTPSERADVVRCAVAAAGAEVSVVPGVAA